MLLQINYDNKTLVSPATLPALLHTPGLSGTDNMGYTTLCPNLSIGEILLFVRCYRKSQQHGRDEACLNSDCI